MILIRYSKLKGAEFIPHLDTLRHLAKILRRAGVNVKYSNGFNPHILIFMSSPIALGLKSESEYCLIDTDDSAENFKETFNKYSLKGIRCEEVWQTEKKAKVASDITSPFTLNSGLIQMIGSFTILRITSMSGMVGLNFTKEQLLDINKKLNKIKLPKK